MSTSIRFALSDDELKSLSQTSQIYHALFDHGELKERHSDIVYSCWLALGSCAFLLILSSNRWRHNVGSALQVWVLECFLFALSMLFAFAAVWMFKGKKQTARSGPIEFRWDATGFTYTGNPTFFSRKPLLGTVEWAECRRYEETLFFFVIEKDWRIAVIPKRIFNESTLVEMRQFLTKVSNS